MPITLPLQVCLQEVRRRLGHGGQGVLQEGPRSRQNIVNQVEAHEVTREVEATASSFFVKHASEEISGVSVLVPRKKIHNLCRPRQVSVSRTGRSMEANQERKIIRKELANSLQKLEIQQCNVSYPL